MRESNVYLFSTSTGDYQVEAPSPSVATKLLRAEYPEPGLFLDLRKLNPRGCWERLNATEAAS